MAMDKGGEGEGGRRILVFGRRGVCFREVKIFWENRMFS